MSSPMIWWLIMGRFYMRYRTFGRTGWQVSEIGYGLWGMGGWTGSDDEESLRALDRALALGCTFFDTAWAYGQGKSESLLGEALRAHSGARALVATKIPPKNMRWPGKAEYLAADTYPPDHLRPYTEPHLAATLDRVDRVLPLVPDGMQLPELALRFILAHPAVSTTIPGMRRPKHVERNLAASDGEPLPPRLLDALRTHRWDRTPNATP